MAQGWCFPLAVETGTCMYAISASHSVSDAIVFTTQFGNFCGCGLQLLMTLMLIIFLMDTLKLPYYTHQTCSMCSQSRKPHLFAAACTAATQDRTRVRLYTNA